MFHIEIEEKCGWIIGGGGGGGSMGMLAPPLKLLGGGAGPSLPTPMIHLSLRNLACPVLMTPVCNKLIQMTSMCLMSS